ncbi:two-component regulator propeller domain-containing protein [Flavobacterium sp. MAHUQ-51]|uniref:two-component regulator propeller domain-containing protein n=1 Tax=Flavobacterium sp. GCM10022190 TaxID=3252639 RepID=UPI003613A09B
MVLQLRLTIWVFCVFLLQLTTLYSQTNVLRFKRITSQNGLTSNRVTAVMQDSNGVLWVGNQIAINRFDGETTKMYHVAQNNNINQFIEDAYKNVWVATEYGLYVLDKKKDEFVKVRCNVEKVNSLFNSNVLCLTYTKGNELIIGGNKNFLVKLQVGKNGQIINNSITVLDKQKIDGYVTKIVKDSNSRFWFSTDKGEVLCLENGVVKKTYFANSGNTSYINDMAIDGFGNLWIATNGNGLYQYNIKNSSIKHFSKDESSAKQSINNNVVTKVYAQGKNVWIGTDGGGLNLYVEDKKTFNYYMYDFGNEFSLADNSVIDIQPGLNGVILLGTVHGGISVFRNNYKIENIPAKNFNFLIEDPQGSRVIEDSFNNIWLSAGRTGLRRYNPKTKTLTVFSGKGSDGFKGNIVLSLFEDKNKRLWVGTLREGVNTYDLKSNTFLNLPHANELKGVFAIAEDNDENIWIGHRKGISIYSKELKLINEIQLNTKSSLHSNQVSCLYKDFEGVMWIGTTDGLFKYEKRANGFVKSSYRHNSNDVNSLSSNNILSIGEMYDHSILIGTYGEGLNKYVKNTGKFERLINEDKIKGAIIRGILKDKQKNIWLSTNIGLTKIDLKNKITNFGISDGISPFNGGAASIDSKGRIIMAGVFGFSYFQPENLKYINYFPHVFFTSVKGINGKNELEYPFSEFANDTVVIEPDSKLLNINFSSSELYSKSSINFQYLMVGLNENWQNLGTQNKISFSNLAPGEYDLRVRATNNPQLWNDQYTTLHVIIEPTFWQRPTVKFLMFIGFILLLRLVYRLRTSSIKKQKEKLQRLLDLKTIEVKQQEQKISQNKISMLEIEKQNQVLKQKKLEDELHFKIDELTNNTLRTMHKNNLLTDIKDKLKKELKNKTIDIKSLEDIVDHINDSFILDADWESFYTLFNQVHPTFVKTLKQQYPSLSEREVRLCALILIDFSSQHIATLFGISLTSVKVARHRLRKKLDIPNDKSVKQFMLDISVD